MHQDILPATTNMKDFEYFLRSPYETGVILETHLGQIKHLTKMAKSYQKKLFFHVDLIHGLKNDEYGTQYLCQEFKPYGLISTKSSVIIEAKKNNVITVQRAFVIDSHALERSYKIIKKAEPDFVEVLPGAYSDMIPEVAAKVTVPVIAGGLIRTIEEAENALKSGAVSITTSNRKLWDHFRPFDGA